MLMPQREEVRKRSDEVAQLFIDEADNAYTVPRDYSKSLRDDKSRDSLIRYGHHSRVEILQRLHELAMYFDNKALIFLGYQHLVKNFQEDQSPRGTSK
ncbi:hypothetical protein [Paenibacillus chitinolyticus]|uniref:hypothetical protein n=1 Tax=Paenibacillus chitinolyticus TaxID=79263 RepID=UPI00365849D7